MAAEQVREVCAVLVCYFPDTPLLEQAIAALGPQVGGLVIVDNGAESGARLRMKAMADRGEITYLSPGTNLGIAGAHNLGIAWAEGRGYTHVLLMDQDSVCGTEMVAKLYKALVAINRGTRKAAAIGPQITDARGGGLHPFIRVRFSGNQVVVPRNEDRPVRVDILISSGTLIPLDVLHTVGKMDTRLFIDNVDVDWCFRAAHMGLKLYGLPSATMSHHLGDSTASLWLFGQRKIVVHGPTRLYYIMRNRVLLYGRRTTPRLWIMQDVYRLLVKFFIFSLLIQPKKQNFAMMTRGLIDALVRPANTGALR